MIQRIQSIYFLFSAVAAFICVFFPVGRVVNQNGENVAAFKAFGENGLVLGVLVVLAGVVSGLAIFLFKKRKVQMSFSRISTLLGFGALLSIFYFLDDYATEFKNGAVQYTWAVALPVISAALSFLAYKQVKKDEEMVKSADRLR